MQALTYLKRLLSKSALFEPLSLGAKAHLLPLFQVIHVDKDTMLYSPGNTADYLYFMLDGKGTLTLNGQTIKLRPGSCFGEESLLDQRHYFGKVSIHHGTLARIKKYRFIELLKQDRKILNEVVLRFSHSFNHKFQPGGEKALRRKKNQQQPNKMLSLIGWAFVLLIPFLSYYYAGMGGFTEKQRIFLSILSGTVVLWGFRLVPEFVGAFFSLLVYLGIGLTDPAVILSGFSSKTFIMALSIFGIAAILLSSGILYRFLLNLLRITPSKARWIMMSLLSLGGTLTPIIPDTSSRLQLATTFLRDTYATIHIKFKGRMWSLGVANALQSATLLGPMFLSSSVRHYVLLGLFWGQYQEQFQWMGWLRASWVTALILGISHITLLSFLVKKEAKPEISKSLIKGQIDILGPTSPYEWGALLGVFLCFLGMMTNRYHHIQPEIIALLILSTLLSFNFIHQKGFNTTINWTELVYLAGLSGLLSTARALELFEAFATSLSDFAFLISNNFEWFILVLFSMISLTRLIMPKGAVVLLYAFFFVPLAQSVGISPWILAFMILVFGESFYFPFQSPEYLNLRQVLYKFTPFNENRVLWINACMNIMKLAAIYGSLPYWKYLGMI
jgi:DASS family divalent anion:Na+ symporter